MKLLNYKDIILNYLNDRSKNNIPSEVVYNELKLENVPSAIYNVSLKEMDRENVIHSTDTSDNRSILILTDAGRKLLSEGGYVKRRMKNLEKISNKKMMFLMKKIKLFLETKDLNAGIKGAYALSIIAIIISINFLLNSIFYRLI